jgi:hypothetical protein
VSDGYSDPRPGSKIGRVRVALMKLIHEHERDGALPTSVRFLFYELVMRGVIKKDDGVRPDAIVSAALTKLREDGHVRWDDIVDETREVSSYFGSEAVAKDLLHYLNSARLDPWDGQVPFIICESRSLAGVLRQLVQQFRCRIASTNGQCRGFLHTSIAMQLDDGDPVGYLGDLDLAGVDIELNTQNVLEEEVGPLDWTRLALTREQVAQYNLPRIRKGDKRYNDGGFHEAVETEALSQRVIINIVRQWLEDQLPEALDHVHARERDQRARLERAIRRIRT